MLNMIDYDNLDFINGINDWILNVDSYDIDYDSIKINRTNIDKILITAMVESHMQEYVGNEFNPYEYDEIVEVEFELDKSDTNINSKDDAYSYIDKVMPNDLDGLTKFDVICSTYNDKYDGCADATADANTYGEHIDPSFSIEQHIRYTCFKCDVILDKII